MALTFTIKRFPSFATIVRKGVFWHYLDSVKRRFPINADKGVPCQSLRISSVGTQSLQVLYHANRISVEFFHVLTDGTGGMVFLKSLVAEYLNILGAPKALGRGVLDANSSVQHLETTNDFQSIVGKSIRIISCTFCASSGCRKSRCTGGFLINSLSRKSK